MAIEIAIFVACAVMTGWVWFFRPLESNAPVVEKPLQFLGVIIEYRQNTHWISILLVVALTARNCYPPFTYGKVLLLLSGILLLIGYAKIMDLKMRLIS
jgi:hypothetical protein